MERTYIKEAMRRTGYTDRRSFTAWAAKCGLPVLRDNSGRLYVLADLFELTLKAETRNDFVSALKKTDGVQLSSIIRMVSQILSARDESKRKPYRPSKDELRYISLFSSDTKKSKMIQ